MSPSRSRLAPARMALELRRATRPVLIILAGLAAALAAFLYIAVRVSPGLTSSTTTVRFAVRDATGVVKGVDEIRVLGIPAGRITNVELDHGRAVITAKLEQRYGPLYRDAEATLRPVTALQDMYLNITNPGTRAAGRLRESDVVPQTQTTSTVGIADVLNVFRGDVRTRLESLLANLGAGLKDRGLALRAAFRELVPLLDAANRMTTQIAARAPITERLVHNSAVLTRELRLSQQQLRTLMRDGSTTLTALQDGSADLDATLRGVPPALTAVDSSFAQVRSVLDDVDTAVTGLRPVARQLSPVLTALGRLSDEATPAVRALQPPVRQLVPVARDLVPLSSHLSAAVSALVPQVSAVDKVTRDLAHCRTGVQGFFHWNASMTKFGDVRGTAPRGNLVIGAQSSGLLNDPGEYAPQACTPGRPIGGRLPTPKDGH